MLIEVGMVTIDEEGDESAIIDVERGQYGLLVKRKYKKPTYLTAEDFVPWECGLPKEPGELWYGWFHHYLLIQGIKIGMVAVSFDREINTIEEYDAEWERTETLMREEEILKWFFGS